MSHFITKLRRSTSYVLVEVLLVDYIRNNLSLLRVNLLRYFFLLLTI